MLSSTDLGSGCGLWTSPVYGEAETAGFQGYSAGDTVQAVGFLLHVFLSSCLIAPQKLAYWTFSPCPTQPSAVEPTSPPLWLETIRPNPFKSVTSVEYVVTEDGPVNLSVFDVTGRMVSVIENGHREAGNYSAKIDLSAFNAGLYFVRLTARGRQTTGKALLVR